MNKRIRLHQVRIGMIVEELETTSIEPVGPMPFLIASEADLDRVLRCDAISAVVRCIERGSHLDDLPTSNGSRLASLWRDLARKFPAAELVEAQGAIEEITPGIKRMMQEVRQTGTCRLADIVQTVEAVMAFSSAQNLAAWYLLRLKHWDEATFLHSLSVGALMIRFTQHLEMEPAAVREYAVGGLVHDIGKVTIPTAILNKPGQLTPAEFDLVKTHAVAGHRLLLGVEGVSQTVLDICLHHHERFDGSGYPARLRGHAIPFSARIAAICDAYDALTTVRPYKRAWSHQEAIDVMGRNRQFDPNLFDIFTAFTTQETNTLRHET